jgi:hypothetical protein
LAGIELPLNWPRHYAPLRRVNRPPEIWRVVWMLQRQFREDIPGTYKMNKRLRFVRSEQAAGSFVTYLI